MRTWVVYCAQSGCVLGLRARSTTILYTLCTLWSTEENGNSAKKKGYYKIILSNIDRYQTVMNKTVWRRAALHMAYIVFAGCILEAGGGVGRFNWA